jgi:hypothetical protein
VSHDDSFTGYWLTFARLHNVSYSGRAVSPCRRPSPRELISREALGPAMMFAPSARRPHCLERWPRRRRGAVSACGRRWWCRTGSPRPRHGWGARLAAAWRAWVNSPSRCRLRFRCRTGPTLGVQVCRTLNFNGGTVTARVVAAASFRRPEQRTQQIEQQSGAGPFAGPKAGVDDGALRCKEVRPKAHPSRLEQALRFFPRMVLLAFDDQQGPRSGFLVFTFASVHGLVREAHLHERSPGACDMEPVVELLRLLRIQRVRPSRT